MSNRRILSDEEEVKLDTWLRSKQIEINNRPSRELGDVVTVAKLFRKLDFKLAAAYSFISHSSLTLKLQDWEAFNLLVLRKMGLTLPRPALEELAAGRASAIKSLLFQVMCAERKGFKQRLRTNKNTNTKTNSNTSTNRNTPAVPHTDSRVQHELAREQESFSQSKYEELIRESNDKDNHINAISQRIERLETIRALKEDQINNLVENLALISVRTLKLQIRLRNREKRQNSLKKQQQKQLMASMSSN